jgi:predicted RNA-binding Zn ribbon-like protein
MRPRRSNRRARRAASNFGREGARLVAPGPPALCLEFANTRCWRGLPNPKETLHRPADLLAWCRRAGLLGASQRLGAAAAASLFTEAISLRELIYRVFRALATKRAIAPADLSALNAAIAHAPARTQIAPLGAHYVWHVAGPREARAASASQLLAAVLWSAADLIVAAEAGRIRQCADDACRWLFLDESRNLSRRWCDMGSCGNRAKARRHYLKQRDA